MGMRYKLDMLESSAEYFLGVIRKFYLFSLDWLS